ncbi:gamma-glutamyltransferase [Teredinibacter haidensis]|uniref:gamma-glutamyltransferase n=1 Tax=Teredinibacter haidensis TaxID=2731755 RepID=UPI001FE369B8|nr:gamma-glutamyltransferase [Teredinibacter haidensis]
MKRPIWILSLLLVVCSHPCFAKAPFSNDYAGMAVVTEDGRGAVASVNSIASQVGLEAFANGGNAVDAAAAIAFTLGVVDSANSGIGGGCFILVRWADGSIEAIDGREMAPVNATQEMFLVDGEYDPSLSKTGALAIGVPGSVAALDYLLKKGGKLSWKEAVLPAVNIAEQGFSLGSHDAKRLARTASRLNQFPASAAIFLDKDAQAWGAGHVLKQPDLARTYQLLADHGSDYFYRGDFAKQVASWMRVNGGRVTEKDFAGYQVLLREPIRTTFHGYDIVGFPPPSSGGVAVAQILNILENFPLKQLTEIDRYHTTIEAMKLAFADRAQWLGDADFANVPKGLIEKSYAKALANKIDAAKATQVKGHSTPPKSTTDIFNRHTTHIAVADREGNWVAITTTLNTSYGSKVTIPGTGVLMNNQMDDFATKEGVPNAFGLIGYSANKVEARKRPLSSMSPTLVLKKGKPVLTTGAAGGPTIITQVVQILVNRLALDNSLLKSMEVPRVHQQWQPERTLIDPSVDESLRKGLDARGHQLADWPGFGTAQSIALENGRFVAVSEPRLKDRMSE